MKTRFLSTLVLAGALLVQAGCSESPEDIANGDDPIKALTVGAASTRYDGSYWLYQREADPPIYQEAVSYCKDQSLAEKPNCAVVMAAHRFATSLERPAPKGRGYTGILSEDNEAPAESLNTRTDRSLSNP